jgi:DNA-directed RNA polymerase subunit RPC12/RpoP/uncharacterized protein YjeT (DUF2065 family)
MTETLAGWRRTCGRRIDAVVSQGRTIGLVLSGVGILLSLVIVGWGVAGVAEDRLRPTGLLLIVVGAVVIVLGPFVGAGLYLMRRGADEATEMNRLKLEQRLMGMIETQGRLSIPQAAAGLGVSRTEVQSMLYDLVGKGLFTGFVDWKAGTVVAQDAAQIQTTSTNGVCPNCGGRVEMVGKGTVGCPYCGAEIFLSAQPSPVGGQA